MLEKMEKLMSEDNNQYIEDTTDYSADGIKQLREEYKKLKAENKQFKASAMNNALSSLGLSADKGIGKAVTKLYDGEVSVDAIKDFVTQEFGEVSSSEQPSSKVSDNVVQAQSRVEQLNKMGVNANPVDVQTEFLNFVKDSGTSTRDKINAKLRMIETLKDNNK
jgi:ribosomal protein L10